MTRESSDRLIALPGGEKLSLIFSIDAVKPELYASLRPGGDFAKILEEIEYLLLRRNKNTWVQIVKMNENFEHLVDYHHFFKKYTANIIIQKYNRYQGRLPERRLNPMQPFEKIDCWHLKREVVVDVEGRVLVCKQDLGKEHVLGNLLEDSMETIYQRGLPFLDKHIRGWDFCSGCDEYYTYNF
ncbi:MAG: SPASM domain-containing protein [Spirochaetia bacterium]|nr:SPASM domain-containing protein [Spirochaetia bacterium]